MMYLHRLEYNGRSFEKDIDDLSVWILEERMKHRKSRNRDGRLGLFFPDVGLLHQWIDKSDGFPTFPTPGENQRHVAQRNLWVLTLKGELAKRFPWTELEEPVP